MVNNEMTAENLRSAFAGESQAYQRYQVWGDRAEKEGFPGVGLLFKAVAFAEQVHAGNHFEVLENVKGDFLVAAGAGFGIGKTAENLKDAIAGEKHEIEQMYPAFSQVAKNQKESEAIKSFHYALEAEKAHAELFSLAKKALDSGRNFEVDSFQVCEVCGYTVKAEAPDKCPVCGKEAEKFREFA